MAENAHIFDSFGFASRLLGCSPVYFLKLERIYSLGSKVLLSLKFNFYFKRKKNGNYRVDPSERSGIPIHLPTWRCGNH